MIALDHVVYAVDDLDAAAAVIRRRYGLDPVYGGEHPGRGTSNAIVPLAGCYVELLAGLGVPEGLVGWTVRTDDIDGHAQRLGVDVVPMTRTRPDGVELRWRLAGWGAATMPVFIQWDVPDDLHPSHGGVHRLVDLEVAGDEATLRDRLGGHDPSALGVHVVAGGAGAGVGAPQRLRLDVDGRGVAIP